MEFGAELALFAAKVLLIVVGVALIAAVIARAARRGDGGASGELKLRKLNDKWRQTGLRMKRALLSPTAAKAEMKAERARVKAAKNDKAADRPRVYVVGFDGNVRASQTASLREELTAILQVGRPGDEVVVRLKSPGGYVHAYGFAASQLERVKERGLKLTAVVDQIAASGGYMMAVVADEIIAAPFAIIGSIGVVAGIPNFNRFLKKHDIDFEQHTAGKYKRTLTVFGENTEAGRQKFKDELEVAHKLFKSFIGKHRPKLDLERVATGEHWFGAEAIELGLVDRLATSDDYLLARQADADVWTVQYAPKRRFFDRAGSALSEGAAQVAEAGVARGIKRGVADARESMNEPTLL